MYFLPFIMFFWLFSVIIRQNMEKTVYGRNPFCRTLLNLTGCYVTLLFVANW